jgi:hypothetical protein
MALTYRPGARFWAMSAGGLATVALAYATRRAYVARRRSRRSASAA